LLQVSFVNNDLTRVRIIKDISHPITFIDRDGNKNPTIGNFTMTVTLPEHVKGQRLVTGTTTFIITSEAP
jgi:GTP cyclohydrolase FolE2